jgi:hypothetical protein
MMFGPFHRLTDSADEVQKVLDSGELWGASPTNFFQSDIPKVKAYDGKLPKGATGFEFETPVRPDQGHVPGKPTWAAKPKRTGIRSDGTFAKIKVKVLRQTVMIR